MQTMIPGLDGLRAIAFLLVFALHTGYLQAGWMGVQFFFVLSGFLITGILLDMKQSLPVKTYFIKFYGRRFLRIFPLYYFYLLLMTGIVFWAIATSFRINFMQIFLDQVWYAVFYVYNFFFSTKFFIPFDLLNHFWSLSVEEQFYIGWPLLILLTPQKYLKHLFLACIGFTVVFRLVFHAVYYSGVFRFFGDSVAIALYPLPFNHIDAFALGAYLTTNSIPKAREQFLVLAAAIPVIGLAAQRLATGSAGSLSALGYPLLMAEAYQYIWGYTLLNYFFAIIIQRVAKEGWMTSFLELRFMRYLGKISYGLYVYHFPMIWFSARIQDVWTLSETEVKAATALLSFMGTLLIASLSYQLIERPFLSLKNRFFPLEGA